MGLPWLHPYNVHDLLVGAEATIAELHAVLQLAFGWGGQHLHRFVIGGVEYGISYAGGVSFGDDPHRVRLTDLGLRPTERPRVELGSQSARRVRRMSFMSNTR
ncbi:MAG TPA: hypothetical protein VM487_08485 [Phycisphaerae bacterium]|nr:hypothetical protein [Phycisphaerae bacterium]